MFTELDYVVVSPNKFVINLLYTLSPRYKHLISKSTVIILTSCLVLNTVVKLLFSFQETLNYEKIFYLKLLIFFMLKHIRLKFNQYLETKMVGF